MPGTFTSDLTTISAAESTTDAGTWTKIAGGTLNVESDAKIEGTNCLTLPTSTTVSPTDSGVSVNLTATFDSTNKHLFVWRSTCTPGNLNTKANQGAVIHLSSDAAYANPGTNYKKWYVDGSDTYQAGGWKCYVIDPSSTPDATGGTLSLTAIKNVANIWRMVSSCTTTFKNTFYDAIRLGTGITITAGTAGAPVTFADIYAADSLNANAWGILGFNSSIYFGSGKLIFGTTGQTAVTYFKESDKTLVFNNFPVATTFYEINLAGAASFKTNFELGTYSGGLASGGCNIKGSGVLTGTTHSCWTFTGSSANAITKLYGGSFSEMKTGAFNSASEIRYCIFNNFGNITTNGCLIDNTTFQNVKTTAPISGTYALIIASAAEAATVTNSKFINCNRAIKITTAGTYAFDNLKFSGNTYDIENSSAGVVTINCSNGSNPVTVINTGGGSTSIVNTVNLTVKCIDEAGANISGVVVYIEKASDKTQLMSTTTNASGIATTSYNYSTDTAINIRLRKSSTGATKYVPIRSTGTITVTGFSVTVTMYLDSIVAV